MYMAMPDTQDTYTVTLPGSAWELIQDWREENNANYAHLMERMDDVEFRRIGRGHQAVISGLGQHDLHLLSRECVARGEHEIYMQSGGDPRYRQQGVALRDAGLAIRRQIESARD